MKANQTYNLPGRHGHGWMSAIAALVLILQITVSQAACPSLLLGLNTPPHDQAHFTSARHHRPLSVRMMTIFLLLAYSRRPPAMAISWITDVGPVSGYGPGL